MTILKIKKELMFKIVSTMAVVFYFSFSSFGQVFNVSGKIIDETTKSPISNAEIQIANYKALSNTNGDFTVSSVSKNDYILTVVATSHEVKSIKIRVEDSNLDVGVISLRFSDSNLDSGIGELTLESDDSGSNEMISGVLSSTSDPFSQAASFAFSPMYFKKRGYDNEYQSVFMNNILMNDAETGRAVWNEWGGLNDVIRNRQNTDNLVPSGFDFGNIGGSTNINARPSLIRKQTKLTLSHANRSYNNRVMFTYSTGLMNNNWAYTISGSRRWSQEGRIEGTSYDAYALYAGVEKKINSEHSLALVSYFSPFKRGQSAAVTQEVYDLAGSTYYNPNWGYQNGEKRNSRIRWSQQPSLMLQHNWTIAPKSKLKTTAAYSFGKYGRTRLNWYKARDPRPDYYRYLPSFQTNDDVKNYLTGIWKENNTDLTQINWDRLYQQNYLSNAEGKQAVYIIENEVTNHNQLSLSSIFNHSTKKGHVLSAGIEVSSYSGNQYKLLEDLLGGNYWVDIDQFAERDFVGDSVMLQNDLDNPNKIIKEGDKFGYNFTLHQKTMTAWGTYTWVLPKFDFYVGGSLNTYHTKREGFMRNGRNPKNSLGKSEVINFVAYNLKGGATYKISGRHFVMLNAAKLMAPPNLRDMFFSPRTSNVETPNNTLENIYTADISYLVRYPNINGRITLYETYFENHNEILRFFHDDLKTFVNMALTKQERIHQGIEAALQVKLNSMFTIQTSASIGNFRYTNRPTAILNYENGSMPDTSWTAYIKNFYVTGTPQTASNLTLKFNKNRWFVELGANYFDKIYLSFNPERRTSAAIENLGEGDPLIKTITQQEKLKGGFTLDFSIGRSVRIKSHYLSVNLNVGNILNNTKLRTGGYEQLRYDFDNKDISKFPPRYYYLQGTNFFFNIAFSL